MLGFSMLELMAEDFWKKSVLPTDLDRVLAIFRRALAEGSDLACDHGMVAPGGRILWVHTGVSGERASGEGPAELHGISIDVTPLKRAEERQAFLADASSILAESRDHLVTLPKLARRAVPAMGECCVIDDVVGPTTVRQLTLAHVDLGLEALLRRPDQFREVDTDAPVGIGLALRTSTSQLHAGLAGLATVASALAAVGSDLPPSLSQVSCMVVPVSVRGRVISVMTFVASPAIRRFDSADLAVAEELGRRVALAFENALLWEEAERATRSREELLAIVSHDLRNGLSPIVTSAGALRKGPSEQGEQSADRVQKLASLILRSAEGMDRLITDLLEFGQLQAGRMPIEPAPVDASELARESAENLQAAAAEKSILLEVEAPDGVGALCDRDRVLRVLGNLLGNAVKFTPTEGHVTLRVRREERDTVFAVTDTGPGIPADEMPRVWGRFWQGITKSQRGVGLGLAIAKALVEAQGGRIWVESAVGVGTTFFFALPPAELEGDVGRRDAGERPADCR